jgi:hypothetical protein
MHITKNFKVPRSRQVVKNFLLRAVAGPRSCEQNSGNVASSLRLFVCGLLLDAFSPISCIVSVIGVKDVVLAHQ